MQALPPALEGGKVGVIPPAPAQPTLFPLPEAGVGAPGFLVLPTTMLRASATPHLGPSENPWSLNPQAEPPTFCICQ